ncbi:DNA primase [Mycobacterium phage Roary]|nr:DNA primase [Mycobacterium phage Roary]
MTDESLIVKVIRRYFSDWEAPKPTRSKWTSCLCPFHGDTNKSASISFELNAFNCFVCGVKGDAIKVIRQREEVTFAEAKRIAESLSEGSDGSVPSQPVRKSSRRVFGDSGASNTKSQGAGRNRQVHARVRGRATPWS